jgi:hypothetical protein
MGFALPAVRTVRLKTCQQTPEGDAPYNKERLRFTTPTDLTAEALEAAVQLLGFDVPVGLRVGSRSAYRIGCELLREWGHGPFTVEHDPRMDPDAWELHGRQFIVWSEGA